MSAVEQGCQTSDTAFLFKQDFNEHANKTVRSIFEVFKNMSHAITCLEDSECFATICAIIIFLLVSQLRLS